MNILQIVPELNAGGVERTSLEITEALIKAGHGAHIASAGGRMEGELARLGGTLHRLDIGSKNPLSLRRNSRALVDIIKANNIDIVHARSRAPAWPARMAAQATGRSFITTYHGIYNARSALKRRYNAIMASGDIIIANSDYTRAHILREHATDPGRIVVIPRGVDMQLFDPAITDPQRPAKFRKLWNLPKGAKALLLPGRLTRWKGQISAIEALSSLPDNIYLVLMGDAQGRDPYVAELWQKAKELGIENRLRITGHDSDMAGAILAADIVLSASTDPEAFGRVAAEAQAMGRPIIATAHGGALETVEDGRTGILVPPGQPANIATATLRALDWPDYDAGYARRRIEAQFSKSSLQSATLKVYESAYKHADDRERAARK